MTGTCASTATAIAVHATATTAAPTTARRAAPRSSGLALVKADAADRVSGP